MSAIYGTQIGTAVIESGTGNAKFTLAGVAVIDKLSPPPAAITLIGVGVIFRYSHGTTASLGGLPQGATASGGISF